MMESAQASMIAVLFLRKTEKGWFAKMGDDEPEFPVSFSDDEAEAEAAQQSRNGFAVETLLHVFQTISDDGKIKTSRTIESVYGSFFA